MTTVGRPVGLRLIHKILLRHQSRTHNGTQSQPYVNSGAFGLVINILRDAHA